MTADLLAGHLPPGHHGFHYFVCGPAPMMDAVEHTLVELGVPDERIHTEPSTWCERGAPTRHVRMTRLVWLIAALLVLACLVFAIVQR